MSEERKLILEMLKEGKINNDEALRLLDAIKDKNDSFSISEDKEKKFENKVNSFVAKILSGVENTLSKAGNVLDNIDFDISQNGVYFSNNRANEIKSSFEIKDFSIDDSIFINSHNGKIELYGWDNEYILVNSEVNYDERQFKGDEEFIKIRKKDNNHYIGLNNELNINSFSTKFEMFIPRNIVKKIFAKSINAKIIAENLETKELEIDTTNAKINCSHIISDNIILNTKNGKIVASNIEGENFISTTTNGKHEYNDFNLKNIKATNTNGSVYLSDISNKARKIELKSTNGGLYIEDIDLSTPTKAILKGRYSEDLSPKFTTINKKSNILEATTKDYNDSLEDKLIIELETTNGKVGII